MHSRDSNSGNQKPLNRETYFSVPPSVTSGETAGWFTACCRKGQWSRGLLLHSIRIPRSSQKVVNNGFVASWTLKEMWLWHPELSEIDAWFEAKIKEFEKKENRNPNHNTEAWLQKYIYTNVHEIFFATFPSELHSWLVRLAACSMHIQSDRPMEWNHKVV